MPQIISFNGELIRINPANNHIESSSNRGVSWICRHSGSNPGTFKDLIEHDGKIFACTSKGIYYSSNKGISWISRSTSDVTRNFSSIQSDGRELLAPTYDGHIYYSSNGGISWIRRR